MSDFLAEARVIVRPDTTQFRPQLQEQVNRAVSQVQVTPLQVPLALGTAGAGLASITAATSALAASQAQAGTAALGLASQEQVLNSALGRQAVILEATTVATQLKAGADTTAAAAAGAHAVGQAQVTKGAVASLASLTGLRGAVLAASTGFLAATIGVQAFFSAVRSAAQLERELNVFRVTAGATADEMSRVGAESRRLGADITLPAVSSNEAAAAMTNLARAGLSVQDSMDAARGALQLATAAGVDQAKSAELIGNALNTFNLAGEDATRVADLLTGASLEASGSIEDMGLALKQVGAVAELVGLSVEDTVTLITALARSGIQGSDAGTSLRTALLRLLNQDALPGVQEALSRLNVQLRDIDGNIRPEVFAEIGRELNSMTPAVRQTTVALLGGQDAVRAFGQLADFSRDELEALSLEVTKQGLAAEVAGAQTQGLTGDLEGLSNEASTAGLVVGQLASPILSSLAGGARGALRGINLVAGGLRELVDPPKAAARSLNDLRSELEQAQQELEDFQKSGGDPTIAAGLRKNVNELEEAFNAMGASAARAGRDLDGFGLVAGGVTSVIEGLITELNKIGVRAEQATPDDGGLNVQQILNRVTGFDAAETRARIDGDTAEIVSVLESAQAFLISQLERQAVKNRPALRRSLEQALLGVTNDIATIQKQGATDTQKAATDAARAQQEADRALLATLANRRDDVERAGEQAEVEGNLQRAIKFEDRLQALIKQQIQKVRDQIDDEKARAAAVRELRLALIASRKEEDALRQERAEAIAANKAEAINLDIDFAETIGNVNREIAARQRLIALLKKQQAAVKKGSNEWKRLRNEIAEQQEAIKEARDQGEEAGEEGRSAQQVLFEAFQKQQGFAANLLGNLIPTNATAGLVGGSTVDRASIPDVGQGIRGEAAAKAGAAQFGMSSGQANTEIDILRQILMELRQANQGSSHPEAKYERATGSSVMDVQ